MLSLLSNDSSNTSCTPVSKPSVSIFSSFTSSTSVRVFSFIVSSLCANRLPAECATDVAANATAMATLACFLYLLFITLSLLSTILYHEIYSISHLDVANIQYKFL